MNNDDLQELVLAYTDLTYAVTPITETVLKMLIDVKEIIGYYEKGIKKLMEGNIDFMSIIKDMDDIEHICLICGSKTYKLIKSKSMIFVRNEYDIHICNCEHCKYIDNEAYKLLVALNNIIIYILRDRYAYENEIEKNEIPPNYITSNCYFNLCDDEILIDYDNLFENSRNRLSLFEFYHIYNV